MEEEARGKAGRRQAIWDESKHFLKPTLRGGILSCLIPSQSSSIHFFFLMKSLKYNLQTIKCAHFNCAVNCVLTKVNTHVTTSTIRTLNISTTSKKLPKAPSSAPIFKYEEAGKRLPATQKRNLTGCVKIKLCSDDQALPHLTRETHCKCPIGNYKIIPCSPVWNSKKQTQTRNNRSIYQ